LGRHQAERHASHKSCRAGAGCFTPGIKAQPSRTLKRRDLLVSQEKNPHPSSNERNPAAKSMTEPTPFELVAIPHPERDDGCGIPQTLESNYRGLPRMLEFLSREAALRCGLGFCERVFAKSTRQVFARRFQ
jgi:hypothetical protein